MRCWTSGPLGHDRAAMAHGVANSQAAEAAGVAESLPATALPQPQVALPDFQTSKGQSQNRRPPAGLRSLF